AAPSRPSPASGGGSRWGGESWCIACILDQRAPPCPLSWARKNRDTETRGRTPRPHNDTDCTMTIRPRRRVLYMPGANARALEKATTLPCDAVILDLEDAVAPDAKESARRQVMAAVAAGRYGAREVIVRINGLDTAWWLDDLTAAAKAKPDGI